MAPNVSIFFFGILTYVFVFNVDLALGRLLRRLRIVCIICQLLFALVVRDAGSLSSGPVRLVKSHAVLLRGH